jgi:hypothetical protein
MMGGKWQKRYVVLSGVELRYYTEAPKPGTKLPSESHFKNNIMLNRVSRVDTTPANPLKKATKKKKAATAEKFHIYITTFVKDLVSRLAINTCVCSECYQLIGMCAVVDAGWGFVEKPNACVVVQAGKAVGAGGSVGGGASCMDPGN